MEIYVANIAAGMSGQKFERSKICIREYISLLCALGGGRSVSESARISNISANMEYTYLRSEHSGGTVRSHYADLPKVPRSEASQHVLRPNTDGRTNTR